jgi:hypothetical protein
MVFPFRRISTQLLTAKWNGSRCERAGSTKFFVLQYVACAAIRRTIQPACPARCPEARHRPRVQLKKCNMLCLVDHVIRHAKHDASWHGSRDRADDAPCFSAPCTMPRAAIRHASPPKACRPAPCSDMLCATRQYASRAEASRLARPNDTPRHTPPAVSTGSLARRMRFGFPPEAPE